MRPYCNICSQSHVIMRGIFDLVVEGEEGGDGCFLEFSKVVTEF